MGLGVIFPISQDAPVVELKPEFEVQPIGRDFKLEVLTGVDSPIAGVVFGVSDPSQAKPVVEL